MASIICSLQRNTTISAGGTEEEEVTQQENMAGMARMVWKIKSKRQNGRAKQLVGGSVNCRLLIVREPGFTHKGRTQCRNGTTGCMKRDAGREKEKRRTAQEACSTDDFWR